MSDFKGVYTALVTPFQNGEVDFESLRRIVKFQESAGISGCVLMGTTGETPTLTDGERQEIFSFVRSETGEAFRLIVGTSSFCTRKAIELTSSAAKWGADAAMVVTPYYNKPPQRGLIHHYLEIAKNSSIPILLYNCPSRTGVSLDVESIEVLSRNPSIIGIKEATGNLEFAKEIIKRCGPDFKVFSGDDASWLQLVGMGGHGVISVISNLIPIKIAILYRYMTSGDADEKRQALKEFERYRELLSLLTIETNPIPVKMALRLMGFIESAELRSPLVSLGEEHADLLEQELRSLGILH